MSEPSPNRPWEHKEWREHARAFARRLEIGPEHDRLVFQALTHRSLAEEAPHGDNERLEFLGDSVLALLVNEHTYRTHPGFSEGQLTRLKAQYVCEPSLALAASALDLGSLLALAPSDEAAGGRSRASILSDTFEAVLAALYLARGIEAAREFVVRELIGRVDPAFVADYKSRLQELYQEAHRATPSYHTEVESGPAHERVFWSEARVDGHTLGRGTGRSKKLAEQAAAADALSRLEEVKAQGEEGKG
jgi:ribonuclease-3